MAKDYSRVSVRPDRVVCNQCGTEMYVDCDTDVCPCCHAEGCLMDVEQEVEL